MDMRAAIRQKVESGHYEFSRHAVDQSILRHISVTEIHEAFLSEMELVEDYPDDFYGPSCLLLGITKQSRPLHILCSHPTRPLVKIITVYEPDRKMWQEDLRKRI